MESGKLSTRRKSKNIRDRYYPLEERPHSFFMREVKALAAKDTIIADIGCGRDAVFLRSIVSNFAFGYGVDLEIPNIISEPKIKLFPGVAEKLPFEEESVNIITLWSVFEHLHDPMRVLCECERVLKPGGHLLILTPNKYHPPIALGRLLPLNIRKILNKIITGTIESDTFPTYYKANTKRELASIVQSVGLTIVELKYISNHPEYMMFSTFIYRCAVEVERNIFQKKKFSWLRQLLYGHFKKKIKLN